MILNQHTIRGIKGKTIFYSLPNFRYDTDDHLLKWDAFKFYTPVGELTDEEGFHFFDVPAEEILIGRDDQLNKEMLIMVDQSQGVTVLESMEGAVWDPITIGLEGDVIASGYIPCDPQKEIVIDYKEVTNG